MVAIAPDADVDPACLGVFDYAHLRAPLPKGIVSGIFKSSPSSYFLMRRSSDGFVSATGMFKATFPYADVEEEETERRYIKSLPTTSHEETAGNVWIPPDQALDLAEEYRVVPWIRALLDPSDIHVSGVSESSPSKKIQPPPKFFSSRPALAPPTPTRPSRARRSASPTKSTGSKRGTATPRKRSTKISSSQSSVSESQDGRAKESASSSLTNGEPKSKTSADDVKVESIEKAPAVVLAPVEEDPKLKIEAEREVKVDEDGDEVTQTKIEIEVPLAGELPSAEDAARMIAEAKEMVKAATEGVADSAAASPAQTATKSKRKAGEIEEDGEAEKESTDGAAAAAQPKAKKVKTEVDLKKERIRKRAFIGIGATVAVG
jgi:hypothetical protein